MDKNSETRYISLGRHCFTSHQIKNCINSNIPTQFFDWSRTDFKCILFILNLRCIDTIFNLENILVDKELYKEENDLNITLKNFVKDDLILWYHHEIKCDEYTELELNEKLKEFIDKYKRRYNRLIELIKSDKKLCFIYAITNGIDYNDCDYFSKILASINENSKYVLVLLIEEEDPYKIIHHNNYIKINLTHFRYYNITPDWRRNDYDWKGIFETIKQNI